MHFSAGIPVQLGGHKKTKKNKKNTCISEKPMIIWKSCDMIAMKREVAASDMAGFPWSECQVRKLTTSHCTNLTAVGTKVMQ